MMMFCNCRFRCVVQIAALLGLLLGGANDYAQLAAEAGLPRGEAKAAGFEPEKLAAVDGLLKKAVGERQIAGGAVLVARRGKVVYFAASGMQDAEAGVPTVSATIYRMASMTKPITSVAAMMLVEEGKIALDDPIAKFIPEFQHVCVLRPRAPADQPLNEITTAADTPVTVRHLLNHTSGLTYGFWDRPVLGKLYREAGVADGLIETPGTMAENCRRLAGVPLMFQPGTAWEYGLNADVLGRVVEVASGLPLGDFLQQRIFEPLGMRDTHFVLPAEKQSRLAALYAPDEAMRARRVGNEPQQVGPLRYSATVPLVKDSQFQSGGGGLVATLGDYARFLQMLLNGGELDGRRVLKPETVAEMTRNQIGEFSPFVLIHGEKFGYGFGVLTEAGKSQDEASVGSYSWGGIFYTYFLVDPERELVIVSAAQIYPFDHLTLHADVKRAVYGAMKP
jgi:CubicO group peptidase (beta-lactamase class C family)